MTRTKAWLELVRLPNIFTAMTDVLAGYWLVSTSLILSWRLGALCLASACLYAYGIVLNDIADVDIADWTREPPQVCCSRCPVVAPQVPTLRRWHGGSSRKPLLSARSSLRAGRAAFRDGHRGQASHKQVVWRLAVQCAH